jgi:ferredoxin-type protein NapH
LPVLLLVAVPGRGLALWPLYCGWLCPHFSLVELLNDLLHRATGKLSLWDKSPTPRRPPPQRRWWPVFLRPAWPSALLWASRC